VLPSTNCSYNIETTPSIGCRVQWSVGWLSWRSRILRWQCPHVFWWCLGFGSSNQSEWPAQNHVSNE
jgi:hypothetical protein